MAKKKPKIDPPDQPSFEEALQRLEEIVHLLEEGDIGLSEALARYEEGVKLLRQSYELLTHAERRIELLSGVDAEGNPITQPFADEATLDVEENAMRGSRKKPPVVGDAGRSGGKTRPEDTDPEDTDFEDTDMDAKQGLF